MRVAEIVEELIAFRDNVKNEPFYTEQTEEALCTACNLLDKMPPFANVEDVDSVLVGLRGGLAVGRYSE